MRIETACASVVRTLAGSFATMIFRLRDRVSEEISSGRGGGETIRAVTLLCPAGSCWHILSAPRSGS
jgi:hypothetical protein